METLFSSAVSRESYGLLFKSPVHLTSVAFQRCVFSPSDSLFSWQSPWCQGTVAGVTIGTWHAGGTEHQMNHLSILFLHLYQHNIRWITTFLFLLPNSSNGCKPTCTDGAQPLCADGTTPIGGFLYCKICFHSVIYPLVGSFLCEI